MLSEAVVEQHNNSAQDMNIDDLNKAILDIIIDQNIRLAKATESKETYINQTTKELIDKRRKLAESGKHQTMEYAEINKTIKILRMKNVESKKRRLSK